MPIKTLQAWNTNSTIFRGQFDSWKECLEAAISQGVSLDYLHLEDADIGAANLDGAKMSYARMRRCRLAGANLSETTLIKSEWTDCDMRDVSMSDVSAVGARFLGTRMNGVDVAYADLRATLVSCTEFLKIDVSHSTHLSGSAFVAQGHVCPMTRGPIFVRGLGLDTVLLDEHVVLGSGIILRRDQFGNREGLIKVFAQHGLKPHADQLCRLWSALRGEPDTQQYAA